MQTSEWAKIKAQTGWLPLFRAWYSRSDSLEADTFRMSAWEPHSTQPAAAALVLQRTLSGGGFSARLRIIYVPKGPLLDWENIPLRRKVLADLKTLANRQGAIFIKIDPDVVMGKGVPNSFEDQLSPVGQSVLADLQEQGWHLSDEQVQFRNTVLIDLRATEDELLARMKQKTRYNIRLAERKGVTIRAGNQDDLHLLYQMYAETSIRDGFVIRPAEYYYKTWKTFIQAGSAEALIAEVNGEGVAAVIVFTFAGKAWYVYGMSRESHREKMPNYLLQWQAMLRAQNRGCALYDLWGAPDEFIETDSLWRVYRFKEGLGGKVVRHIGAWDFPTRPLIYRLYTKILPNILEFMRQKGKVSTRKNVGI